MTTGGGAAIDDHRRASALPLDGASGPPEALLAPWGRRVVAVLLDQALLATVAFLAFGGRGAPVPVPGSVPQGPVAADVTLGAWTVNGVTVAMLLALLLLQAYLGSTPGKLAVGVVVVRERDGRPLGLPRTLARLVLHVVDTVLVVGYLRPLWHPRRQTFADSLGGSVVLVTRRPLPYRYRAVEPPPAWQLPAVPRWRVWTTGVAVAACAVGVAFQLGSTGRGAVVLEESCALAAGAPDDVTGLVGGSLAVRTEVASETRLGVTRPLPGGEDGIRVTWDRSGPVSVEEDDVVVRLTLRRADGTGTRVVDHALSADGTVSGPGLPLADGSTGVLLPPETVEGLGDGWTWTLSTVVDGVPSPTCTPVR